MEHSFLMSIINNWLCLYVTVGQDGTRPAGRRHQVWEGPHRRPSAGEGLHPEKNIHKMVQLLPRKGKNTDKMMEPP